MIHITSQGGLPYRPSEFSCCAELFRHLTHGSWSGSEIGLEAARNWAREDIASGRLVNLVVILTEARLRRFWHAVNLIGGIEPA
jgi:hypothetical protein